MSRLWTVPQMGDPVLGGFYQDRLAYVLKIEALDPQASNKRISEPGVLWADVHFWLKVVMLDPETETGDIVLIVSSDLAKSWRKQAQIRGLKRISAYELAVFEDQALKNSDKNSSGYCPHNRILVE